MAWQEYRNLIKATVEIYGDIDRRTRIFRMASGIRCPAHCGSCCETREVETTVLECLPLANEVLARAEEDTIVSRIEDGNARGDSRCVLYRPEPEFPGKGGCSYYRYRPLVCRLFGFSCRRNRLGHLEVCLCGIAKQAGSGVYGKPVTECLQSMDAPVYQDSFLRIASLHPGLGYRLLPITTAVKQAIEFLEWRRPRRRRFHKAA